MGFSLKTVAVSEGWFNRLVVGAMALGFLALLATGITAYQSIRENQFHAQWVTHTFEVERAIGSFNGMIERAETGRRGYILSGAPNTLRTYNQSRGEVVKLLDRIDFLTRDNIRQQVSFKQLTALTRQDLDVMDRSVAMVNAGHRDQAVRYFQGTITLQTMRAVREVTAAMLNEEDRLLALRNKAEADTLKTFYVTIALAGLILLLVGSGSIWVILRYTRDLTRSRDELRLLNTDLEGAVRERTTDLQRANEEIQRFAYIVSHDLRSPLVNVMGFTAELESSAKRLGAMMDKVEAEAPDMVDKDAKLAAREDLPEAIGFIRTSTQKMDRLINAILRLSREGRRPITPEKLDMDAVLQGIADTQRHRLDEKDIDLSIAHNLPDIVSDRLAIEQVIGNIVENAVKYMSPGRKGRIEVRGRKDGQRAIFEVADNGRGIDPKDHDRIFDLFRRSGLQDQPGEGIGLAHTRALAYRLGGTISVESELGRGATFRINLPVAFQEEQGALP